MDFVTIRDCIEVIEKMNDVLKFQDRKIKLYVKSFIKETVNDE